jgi:two-component system response regulator DctR
MPKPKPLIRLVDDDLSVLAGLEYLLKIEGYESRSYTSAGDFLLGDDETVPGCAVLDIKMPGMSGLELQNNLIERKYPHPLIFLSGHGDIDIAVSAVKKGALDFLQKPINPERFLAIVSEAIETDRRLAKGELSEEDLLRLLEKLTDREHQIIRLLLQGVANRDIAERLSLSTRTVENHRAAAYRKLEVNSLEQLTAKFKTVADRL